MLHTTAIWYATWLTTPVGQSEKPPILYVFVFCPLAIVAVIAYSLPYYAALWHGASLADSLQGISKHGVPFSQPIGPWITTGVWVICASLVPLLSALAFQFGWLGRDVREGE